jgi:Terpene cyclase DEP1
MMNFSLCKTKRMTDKHRSNAIFFFAMAGVGLATAWYFNALAVMRGENYIADGFTSNVDWVYSLDLLIGGTAGMAFIVIEARRLKMRRWGLYIAFAFVTAFAFVFPLFLGFRELAIGRQAGPSPASTPSTAAASVVTPTGGMKPPSVHIRAVITWLAIFPLVTLGFLTIVPAMGDAHPILKVFILTLVVVPLAVYLVVPNLMKLAGKLAAKRSSTQ